MSVSNTAAAAGKAGDVQIQQQAAVRDKQTAEYSALTDTRQCYCGGAASETSADV